MSADEERGKSRARKRRAKKRLEERKKTQKTRPARKQKKVVRPPRMPYAASRSLIKVLKAATVALACLLLLEASIVAAISFLLVHTFGDFLLVSWVWARNAAMTLFAAGVLQVVLSGMAAIFDVWDQNRELLAIRRGPREESRPVEEMEEGERERDEEEVDAENGEEEAKKDRSEGEEPPPLGSGA